MVICQKSTTILGFTCIYTKRMISKTKGNRYRKCFAFGWKHCCTVGLVKLRYIWILKTYEPMHSALAQCRNVERMWKVSHGMNIFWLVTIWMTVQEMRLNVYLLFLGKSLSCELCLRSLIIKCFSKTYFSSVMSFIWDFLI